MNPAARLLLAIGLMVASGFAGLAYQIVWIQQAALWLGQESAAVIAVVAAFFGGLALGASLLGARIERSAQPVRWYAACELVLAVWSLSLALLLAPVADLLLSLTGPEPSPLRQWSVAFCGTFLVLLPATAAMGATLPALERARLPGGPRTLAALYAANTAGAMLGVLGTALWLLPRFGLARTAALCALVNLACAAAALALAARVPPAPRVSMAGNVRLAWLLGLTGLLGVGYEILVVRALSQLTENTVYTFAILLALYLAGTALGAACHARWLAGRDASRLRRTLLRGLALSCLLGLVALSWKSASGAGAAPSLAHEARWAALLFLPPTFLMGALFSELVGRARAAGLTPGRAIGANTLGAALAPPLFGAVLIPMLALKLALLLLAAGYLLLAAPRSWKHPVQWSLAAALLTALLWLPPLRIVTLPAGGHVLDYVDGRLASVAVLEDDDGVRTLHINNRQQEGSNATVYADGRQALLPLSLHAGPRTALFLGFGTGLTASSATLLPGLEVEAVELVPEVIQAFTHFRDAIPDGAQLTRLTVHGSDARRFLRTRNARYDVIVSDNFHPARSGSSALYTPEHFAQVKAHLADGGLFCQWLPLHQLDLASLRSIIASFLAVYPRGAALLATNSLDTPTLGLIAHRDGEPLRLMDVRHRLAAMPGQVRRDFDLGDELAVLGSLVSGPEGLRRFAAGARPNTDDHPVVSYLAPYAAYAATEPPRDRLARLLGALQDGGGNVLDAGGEPRAEARIAAYRAARNLYIDIGRQVRPVADVRAMLAQVRGPLMEVLRLSPDFQPAYEPLLQMAAALRHVDPMAADELLAELQALHPGGMASTLQAAAPAAIPPMPSGARPRR